MEAQRPAWSEEELPQPKNDEREVPPDSVAEKSQALSFAEDMVAAEAIKKQPLVAFRAAETGQAKEGALERRQEVRDEPWAQQAPQAVSDKPSVQQAVPIASLIADLPARQPNLAQAVRQNPRPPAVVPADEDTEEPATNSSATYRQAIKVGFVGALLFILAFVLLQISI